MSHEQAPNILSAEEHKALEAEISAVGKVAHEADMLNQGNHFSPRHNGWVDGARGEDSTRMLGDTLSDHKIQHRSGLFGNINDARTDVHIRTDERKVHSYSDRRYGATATDMEVSRNGKEKRLRSENPLVFKMLTRIALKDIEQQVKEDIDKHPEEKAA